MSGSDHDNAWHKRSTQDCARGGDHQHITKFGDWNGSLRSKATCIWCLPSLPSSSFASKSKAWPCCRKINPCTSARLVLSSQFEGNRRRRHEHQKSLEIMQYYLYIYSVFIRRLLRIMHTYNEESGWPPMRILAMKRQCVEVAKYIFCSKIQDFRSCTSCSRGDSWKSWYWGQCAKEASAIRESEDLLSVCTTLPWRANWNKLISSNIFQQRDFLKLHAMAAGRVRAKKYQKDSKSYDWLVKGQDGSATDPTPKSKRVSRTANMAERPWMIAQHREAVQPQDFYANKSADRKRVHTLRIFENGLNLERFITKQFQSVISPVSTARGNPSYISTSADIAKFAGCEFIEIRLWHLQCLPLCTSPSRQVFVKLASPCKFIMSSAKRSGGFHSSQGWQ